MTSQQTNEPDSDVKAITKRNRIRTVGACGLLVIFVILIWRWWEWSVIGYFEQILLKEPTDDNKIGIDKILGLAGPYGDLFGGINALFTGLGLAFLIYTIYQQSEMIRQQQISINQQTEDLRNQKIAAERAQALQSILQIRTVLQDEETREARRVVLSGVGKPTEIGELTPVLLKQSLHGEESLSDDERLMYRWHLAAERVLHSYDFVGVLMNCGHLQEKDLEVIRNTWGQSIRRCHKELRDYMKQPFRPKEIRKTDLESVGTKRVRLKKLGASRLHALPYKNFNDLYKMMNETTKPEKPAN
ncbi:MAG: hypothetical protein KGQ60_00260 [Planctomycetes bacterium]|nr:hypothetical protein [Planctomycetota bacterium]